MQLLERIQEDFTGGLYKRFGTYMSPPNTASKLQNADVSKGGFRKIPGYSALNVSIGASSINSLYTAYIGAKRISLATAGTFMYYYISGSSSFASCVSGLTANNPWSFVTYKNGTTGSDYIYTTNGVDGYIRIDVSSYPAGAPTISVFATPNNTYPPYPSKQLFIARERLWAIANASYRDRGYYCSKDASGVGLPELWDSTKYLAFPRETANFGIVGGIDWKDMPFILTERTASLVMGDNNSEFEQPILDGGVGCAARRTIQPLGDSVIFLGWKGAYVFMGGKCHLISLNIQDYIDDINPTYISNAVAIADENCYYLSYTSTAGGGTINNRTLIFDTRIGDVIDGVIKGGWTGPHTIGAAAFMRWNGPGDNGELFFADASATGLVHKFMDDTKTSFNGANIDMDVETIDINYSEVLRPDLQKNLDSIVVIAEPEVSGGSVSASYYNDNNSSDTAIGAISLATTGPERGDKSGQTSVTRTIINYPINVTPSTTSRCYFNRLRFRCNDALSQCKVRKYIQTSIKAENQ